jgi:sugar-specific transcriptional regulator TrmB
MDMSALRDLGLSDGEIKVYLALLKTGLSKTGKLAGMAGVSSSKVYKILDRLEKKGLVSHVLKGKVKHFRALEPRRILDYLDERQAKLASRRQIIEGMLPELERQRKAAEEKPEGTVCSGFKAVTNLFRNMIDELEEGECYYVIGAGYGETPGIKQFFVSHHARRQKHGVWMKMLANFDEKGTLVGETKGKSAIRYLPHYLITNMEIVFYKEKAFIVLWTIEPTAFVIESKEAVKSFRKYFDALWKIAKG